MPHPVIYDGAMGTELMRRSQIPKVHPIGTLDALNLTFPEAVRSVHLDYYAAGANVLTTNTFAITTQPLDDHAIDVIATGVQLARVIAGEELLVAASMGPLSPGFPPDQVYGHYYDLAKLFLATGADIFLLESQTDDVVVAKALIAFRDAMGLTLNTAVVHVSFTQTGQNPTCPTSDHLPRLIKMAEAAWVDIIGVNCWPPQLVHVVSNTLRDLTTTVALLPNAGYPEYMEPQSFAHSMAWIQSVHNFDFLGGCCGTTPAHIAALKLAVHSSRL